jgi:negative regulator of flagellin synthesis FlgM
MYGELDVTTKINGLQNRPVQAPTEKSAARARDAAPGSAEKAAPSGPVRITEQARQLAALEQAVQSAPIIDETRVAAIRQAIDEGSYEVMPERIADKLLRMDRDLAAAEK